MAAGVSKKSGSLKLKVIGKVLAAPATELRLSTKSSALAGVSKETMSTPGVFTATSSTRITVSIRLPVKVPAPSAKLSATVHVMVCTPTSASSNALAKTNLLAI